MARQADRQRVDSILNALALAYPDVKPGLHFTNPFELLIATILSAQCTDKQVNKVTPALFSDYPDAKSIAGLSPEALAPYIKSCGFYAVKSKTSLRPAESLSMSTTAKCRAPSKRCRLCRAWEEKPRTLSFQTLSAKTPSQWTRTCFACPTGWVWPRRTM